MLKSADLETQCLSPSYPASSFPLTSGRETATLERLPVELRMCSRKTKHGVNLVPRASVTCTKGSRPLGTRLRSSRQASMRSIVRDEDSRYQSRSQRPRSFCKSNGGSGEIWGRDCRGTRLSVLVKLKRSHYFWKLLLLTCTRDVPYLLVLLYQSEPSFFVWYPLKVNS